MKCPECGCQCCPNCLGAICDCNALDHQHDRNDCDGPRFNPRLICGHHTETRGEPKVGSYITCRTCQRQVKVIAAIPA